MSSEPDASQPTGTAAPRTPLDAASLPRPRADLLGMEPYGAPQLDVPHMLNVNENPFPPSEALRAALADAVVEAAAGLNRYPDREARALRADLAQYLAEESHIPLLPPEQVWAANGSNEVMHQLLLAYGGPGRTVLGFTPHYSMYPEYARDTYTRWVAADRGPAPDFALRTQTVLTAIEAHKPDMVLLTSPNNPTGTALDLEVAEAAAQALAESGGLLVIDEAYAEFRRDGVPSALTLLARYPNIAVARTMSKAFALAGARLGYLAAHPAIIDTVRIVRLPYHLSAVTQAVARTAIAHRTELLGTVDLLRRERDALAEHLVRRGHAVATSDANFLLFRTFTDRHAVFTALLERGILIREVGPHGYLRVSIGTPEDNAAFRTALEDADPIPAT